MFVQFLEGPVNILTLAGEELADHPQSQVWIFHNDHQFNNYVLTVNIFFLHMRSIIFHHSSFQKDVIERQLVLPIMVRNF